MPKSTLFAYAQGSDLDAVVEVLEARCDALVAERKWVLGDVWVVNQREPAADGNGGTAYWDVGLNLTLPAGKARPEGWVDDLVAIATLFGKLHGETKRTFALGVADAKTGATKDVFFVDSATPDLAKLRSAFEGAVS
jgi:hypothetical protein